MKNNRVRGFTLIELLVSLLIIGVLAGIALPSLLNQRSKAEVAKAQLQLDTVKTFIEEYAVEHEGNYPPDQPRNVVPPGVTWIEDWVYGSSFDYDNWGIGNNTCVAQVSWWGKSNEKQYANYVLHGSIGEFIKIGDNLILIVAIYECNNPVGEVR